MHHRNLFLHMCSTDLCPTTCSDGMHRTPKRLLNPILTRLEPHILTPDALKAPVPYFVLCVVEPGHYFEGELPQTGSLLRQWC